MNKELENAFLSEVRQNDALRARVLETLSGPEAVRPRPVTIKEAANVLGCCPATIRRYARLGIVRPIVINSRRKRWDLNQIERIAANGVA
ncbi:MAG: MerR family transcriptional regulator [Kiritimatiellia bacterium]